jgi:hypothetical protein
MSKNFLLSKTLWLNAIALVATGTGFASGSLTSYPTLVCVLVLVQSIANLALRLLTKEAITLTAKPQSEVAKG